MPRIGSLSVFTALTLVGCKPPNSGNKAAAEANGLRVIAEARQFAAEFPDSIHFISHYTGSAGPPIWNSKVGLNGRYVLGMSFEIDFDPDRKKPSRAGEPKFHLREVSSIEIRPDGSVGGISYSGHQTVFGPDDWQKLIQADGDFSALGFEIDSDRQLEHFDEAWPSATNKANKTLVDDPYQRLCCVLAASFGSCLTTRGCTGAVTGSPQL